ncbi:hypothetical protein ACFSKL_13875 [Belliella marina]|uniref:Uncharacterized protein n=1 Tax=Belliella marina TaxID=1644146 RepID=A0ABW4VNW6_9BACT
MNLNKLKPAWRQFLLQNSMELADEQEILFIIGQEDFWSIKVPRLIANIIMVIVLVICFQGG